MKNKNISDFIEQYLKSKLSNTFQLDIRRSELASIFHCVPSQINYVINTRFTLEQGYIVESKRGGGGYIRIVKIKFLDNREIINFYIKNIKKVSSEKDSYCIINRLYKEKIINKKMLNIMKSLLSHKTLNFDNNEGIIRSRLLISLLNSLKYCNN